MRRVLIVDDSTTIRSLVKVYLMGKDFEFVEASDGELGLKALLENQVDLVLVDFNMPRMDGLSFLRAVRAHGDGRVQRTPVVLLSSERKINDLESKSLGAGANMFLPKPVNVNRLVAAVDRLLGSATA